MILELDQGVAILRMNAGKANAIGPTFLQRLDGLLDDLAASEARAAVLVGYDKFFSAGLDLPSLVDRDRAGMAAFMRHFGETMLRVFALPMPVVAAINGHAVAGGCVLALMADVRLMAAGNGRIGLNEVQLGIGLPAEVIEPLRLQLPPASWLPIALAGKLVLPDEAVRLGLVQETVAATELLVTAVALAAEMAQVPNAGFAQVKAALRRPTLAAVAQVGAQELERWLDTWFDVAGQTRIQAAVAKLAGR